MITVTVVTENGNVRHISSAGGEDPLILCLEGLALLENIAKLIQNEIPLLWIAAGDKSLSEVYQLCNKAKEKDPCSAGTEQESSAVDTALNE